MRSAFAVSPLHLDRKVIQKFFDKKTGSGNIMRNMSVLTTGTAKAQFVGFIAAPVITRIYSPADFGVLSLFSAFLFWTCFI